MAEVTDGELAAAWVREVEAKLTPQARRRLARDPEISYLIVRAVEAGWEPEALARDLSYGIGWQQPENAREVMVFRLNRAIGGDHE